MKFLTTIFVLCLFSGIIFAAEVAGKEPINLIPNSSFESLEESADRPANWSAHRGTPLLQRDGGHTGKNYLRLVDAGPGVSLFIASQEVAARPEGKYEATAWMRTNDKGRPGIYINFYNDQGRRIHNVYARASGPTKGWVNVKVSAQAPATASIVTVSLYSYNGDRGTFDFDDVKLHVTGGQEPLFSPRVKPTKYGVVKIGSRRELFVDRFLIDGTKNVRLVLNRPHDEGIILKFDKPWEGLFCGYCTVLTIDSGYRVYYRGRPGLGKDGDDGEVTCIAESKDGLTWTKPKLGLHEYNGSSENNIILRHASPYTHNFSPFVDSRPGVLPGEKFKSLSGLHPEGLALWVSADGLRWKLKKKKVIVSKDFAFDSQACTFWSETEKQYLCYFRTWNKKVRSVSRTTSQDCLTWSKPERMTFGDTPMEHLYTNQTQPYFRAPHLYVATAARFMPGRQVITEEQAKRINVNPKYFKDTSDAVLLTSRGKNRYDRTFMSGFIRPGIGAHNWVSRTNYPALNIVQTGANEMSLFVNQDYAQPSAHLRRYAMRLDGFASAQAEYSGGELLTKPLLFSGKKLSLNFATSAAGYIRIEVQDEKGKPIPGFTMNESRDQIGNEIDRIVTWKSNANLAEMAGKPVRLRFMMKDADLYSLQFVD